MVPAIKQSLRVLEIPISKIAEEVIPYYQGRYDKQKILICKLVAEKNIKELQKEILVIRKAIMQLKDLMYELDNLKLQVGDSDVDKFDEKTKPLCKSIINLMSGYRDLLKLQHLLDNCDHNGQIVQDFSNSSRQSCQIQISENLEDLKLHEYSEICSEVEALHEEVNDLHHIFDQLNGMVLVQDSSVQDVFGSVEGTANNVNGGLHNLQTAHRLKMTAYPLTGAFLGGMLGGPIGIVAGAKIGGLASLCCAIAGFTGGKLLKNSKLKDMPVTTNEANSASTIP